MKVEVYILGLGKTYSIVIGDARIPVKGDVLDLYEGAYTVDKVIYNIDEYRTISSVVLKVS